MSSEEDTDLTELAKNEQPENKGLLTKFAEFLGIKVVEKGDVAEMYEEQAKENNFWAAKDALSQALRHYDPRTDKYVYETDENKIREALEDFSNIINGILTGSQPVVKAVAGPETVEKDNNKAALQGVYESLGSIIKSLDGGADKAQETNIIIEKEDEEVTKAEAQEMIAKAVAEALNKNEEPAAVDQTEGAVPEVAEKAEETSITPDIVEKMVAEAVEKAQQSEEPKVTMDEVQEMIAKAVEEAVEPIRKANRLPSNLNDTEITKKEAEQHYLHGVL